MSATDTAVAQYLGDALPIGTPVTYWPGLREGDGIKSVTRSNVWDLCGTPVVMVRGYAGGIALTHIAVRELDEHETDTARQQALRDHVADLLTDVDHFEGCKANPDCDCDTCVCTCLVGRIRWAITAEQIDGAA